MLASARPGQVPASPPSSIATISSIDPTSIDWVVVQMHQCVMSSSSDNGCDKGIREIWKPLFDQYQVDLVVNGHDHDYERSQPVNGYTPAAGQAGGRAHPRSSRPSSPRRCQAPSRPRRRPRERCPSSIPARARCTWSSAAEGPMQSTTSTSRRTAPRPTPPGVHTLTIRKTGTSGTSIKPPADAYEPVVWSALTDPAPATGANSPYGIALFDVNPGDTPGGEHHIDRHLLPLHGEQRRHRSHHHAAHPGHQSRLRGLRPVRPDATPERRPGRRYTRVRLPGRSAGRSGGRWRRRPVL